jgi:hypothetical protein
MNRMQKARVVLVTKRAQAKYCQEYDLDWIREEGLADYILQRPEYLQRTS